MENDTMRELLKEMVDEMKEYISDADGETEYFVGYRRGATTMISIMKSYFTGIEGAEEAFDFDLDELILR